MLVGVVVVGLLSQRSDDDPGIGAGGVVGSEPGSGQSAPDVVLPRLDAPGELSLASFRGRPVVLNFFASWCAPCLREMPAFQDAHRQLGDRVAFVGINHLDDRDGAVDTLERTGVEYPAGYDPDGNVAEKFSLLGMPSTVFLSADGRVLERHTGEMSREKLEDTIARLFGF